MDIQEIITLIIAIWGAFLSTYLASREIRREKRKIKIIVELVSWVERFQLTIINIGFRPVTIIDISISIDAGIYQDPVPFTDKFDLEHPVDLPFTLKENDHKYIILSEHVTGAITNPNSQGILITVYDVEGNQYSEFTTREHDVKLGTLRTRKTRNR